MMPTNFAFELSRSDIHIWTFPATVADDVVAEFARVLAPDETDRAARFRFSHLRDSFVIAHGVLRFVLGRYLGIDPADIQFSFGSNGKPAFGPTHPVRFNMSHSGDLTVIALAVDCEIGVDTEKIRSFADMQQIAGRFFCQEEVSELMSVPESEREHAFFCCWTRKEAYIKAIGAGLSVALDGFRVTVHPQAPARFVHIEHDTSAAEAWTLRDLSFGSGYAGALAYRAPPRGLCIVPISDLGEVIRLVPRQVAVHTQNE